MQPKPPSGLLWFHDHSQRCSSHPYSYATQVSFGPHRMMMRPRDSHDLRLIDTALTITPSASVRWLHDVFGNSVAIAEFWSPGMSCSSSRRSTPSIFRCHRRK